MGLQECCWRQIGVRLLAKGFQKVVCDIFCVALKVRARPRCVCLDDPAFSVGPVGFGIVMTVQQATDRTDAASLAIARSCKESSAAACSAGVAINTA